jgi:alpha-1,2-mannosyltransferase
MPAKHARSAVVILGCLAVGSAMLALQLRYGLRMLTADLAAVREWRSGGHLEAPLTAPAALMLSPLCRLSLGLGAAMLGVAGVVALVLALIALAGPVARRYGRSRFWSVLAAAALAVPLEPVRSTLGLGSLDLLLFGLVVADVVALRRSAWARRRAAWWPGAPASRPPASRPPASRPPASRPPDSRPPAPGLTASAPPASGTLAYGLAASGLSAFAARIRRGWATGAWAGVGTGIATALAISPCLFIAYLAVTRQWRAATTATLTAVALLTGARLTAPGPAAIFPGLTRSGPFDLPDNQSLAGVLARLYESTSTPVLIWLSFASLLIAVGMIRARSAHHDGDEITAFTLVGLTSAAAGPVSHLHSLIWLLPAVLILVDAAARRRMTVRRRQSRRRPGAGFAIAALLVYLLLLADPRWMVGWNGYAFTLILLLNALPWRPGAAPALAARRHPQQPPRIAAIPGPRGR